MNKELFTLVASIFSLVGSLIAIFISTKLAISKVVRVFYDDSLEE